jgi:predicted NBD/HSP70 family sugar kinase
MQPDVQTQLREQNLTTILRCLKQNAPISRAQLASLTGLTKATVSSLIEELIDLGLIHETGYDTSGRRRPATLLELNAQSEHAIGIEIGDGFVLAVLSDLTGHIIWRGLLETDPKASPDEVVETACSLVDRAASISRSYGNDLLGLGVALSGVVDVESGTLLYSPGLQWRDIPIGALFAKRTGLAVYVENNANAAAIGEHFFGVAHRVRNFVFVLAGVGLRCGLFLNGDIYSGAGGMAGELGHVNFTRSGNLPCRCGDRGCWETSANQFALVNRVRVALDVGQPSILRELTADLTTPLTFSLIQQAAERGDAVALNALRETGEMLGVGIASIINAFNPEMVIIGGNMSRVSRFILPAIHQEIALHALPEAQQQAQIAVSEFYENAIAMGAATLAIRDILANPRSVKR